MPPDAIASSEVVDDGRSVVAAGARVGAQQQLEAHRLRELRRAAEPAPLGSNCWPSCCERGVEHVGAGQRLPLGRRELRRAAEWPRELRRPARASSSRRSRHASSTARQSQEARHAVARLREVGAAEERPAVGRQEHGHRPAAVTGHRLHRVHVDRVDVGSFLAVDLHVDEQVVHHRGDARRPRRTRGP